MEMSSIDIKSEGQVVSVALATVLVEIDVCNLGGIKLIKVLHGYGSHGTGGEIKKQLHSTLSQLKRQKKIVDFVPCEKWNAEKVEHKLFARKYPILLIDEDLNRKNSGQTLIIL